MLVAAGVLVGFGGGVLATLVAKHSSVRTPQARAATTPAARVSARISSSPLPAISLLPSPTASLDPRPRSAQTGPQLRAACTDPAACGFPNAADTGPGSTPLTPHSGNLDIRTDGTVISGWDLTGSLDVYANNVTVIDSRITSTNWWGVNLRPGYTGLRILHSYLTGVPGRGLDNGGEDYAMSNMGTGSVEVGWCDMSVFGNTISTGHGYIHDNYVHGLVPFINKRGYYQHTDAVIEEGGDTAGLDLDHNTLLNPIRIDQGASAAIGLYPDSGAVTDVTIKDNWLAGGAYTLYGGGPNAARMVVTGNVFSGEYWPQAGYYGAIADWHDAGAGNSWSGNTFSDGTQVAAP